MAMKAARFMLGVYTSIYLVFIALFTQSSQALAGSHPVVGGIMTITFFGSVILTWAVWIVAVREQSPSDLFPVWKHWLYAATVVFGVLNHWFVHVIQFDRLYNISMVFEGLVVSFLFIGFPLATAILLVLEPFRKEKI